MNNDNLTDALNAINFVNQLFQAPSCREEEELRHLLNAVLLRLQEILAECDGSTASENR